ncbi:hypothetical protein B0T24DRAFT_665988 [Lasiosphaeria ovina]|uniref:Uncharacterized protein n=1 Tax=Lasiosphaeria ovina TaxID=92902 RepID=A0AAE0KI68_9PEZI|nr:hypothetical protein B0T24DRAFT_665988 [Lasiosphaeria ovina]
MFLAAVDISEDTQIPQQIQASDVDELISGPVRDVFIRHEAEKAFALYLSHRHHQVAAGKAVVKVNGTAHLMGTQDMQDIEAVGNKIVPTTWMGSAMLPMEFAVVSRDDGNEREEAYIPVAFAFDKTPGFRVHGSIFSFREAGNAFLEKQQGIST